MPGLITGRIVSRASSGGGAPIPVPTPAVENVAQLRLLAGDPGSVPAAIVTDSLTGGEFAWDPSAGTDDGGTRFNAAGVGSSSAGWRRIFQGPIYVDWFGADSTGASDTTGELQRALALAASAVDKRVILSQGTYAIDAQSLSITGPAPFSLAIKAALQLTDSVTLQGAGRELTSLQVSGTRGADLDLAIYGSGLTGCVIKDLTIDGNAQQGIDIGIDLWDSSHCTLENVRVTRACVHGFAFRYGSSYNVLRNCYASNNGNVASPSIGFGITLFGLCNNNVVEHCVCETPGTYGLGGIYIDSSEFDYDGGSCEFNTVRECYVTGYLIGIGVEGSSNNLIQGNTVDGWLQNGILVGLSQDNIRPVRNTIANNSIIDAAANGGEAAIALAGAFETNVVGNLISNAGTNHGIRIGPPVGNTLNFAPARWEASHGTYTSGDRVAGKIGTAGEFRLYTCITTGTGAVAGDGPTSTSSNITDNAAHWRYDITHPGVASRNVIRDNVINSLTGSGIFIETGRYTEIAGNRIVDANPVTPGAGIDAPIRVQNTITTSIIDLPIDDVVIHDNMVIGSTGISPGIQALTQASTDELGTITDIRCSHNHVRDVGAAAGIQFVCLGAALTSCASAYDDVLDTRGTPSMLGGVRLYNNTAHTITANVDALQARVSGGYTTDTTGSVTLRKHGHLNGLVINADVDAAAAIAGTKISPDFGSQNIATTGKITFYGGGKLDTHSGNYVGCWFGSGITPASDNFAVISNGSDTTYLNVPGTGTIKLSVALGVVAQINSTNFSLLTPANFQWDETIATPKLYQVARSTDVDTTSLTIQAQTAKTGATGSHRDGGHLILRAGDKAAGGVEGSTKLQNGSGTTLVEAGDSSKLAFFGGALAAKPSITGALSTVADAPAKAVMTSIIAALVNLGLATDGTT